MRGGKRQWNDNHYGYPFKQADGGRANAKKKYWGDCGPIALAIATGRSYDECTEALAEDGMLLRSTGSDIEAMIHSLEWQKKDFYGLRFEKLSFPAVKGQVRMRAGEFCEKFPAGSFILRVSRHYIACVDGVVMGEYPIEADRCIYGALRVVQANRAEKAA